MPTIMELLQKYYDEAHGGLVNDKTPSQLCCGEGTQADYYILKVDLCRSTAFIQGKYAQTYLKLAHVFLSTVDDITRRYGADEDQVEYAGDSVVAYFRGSTDAINVLKVAYYSRVAVSTIPSLDPIFKSFPFQTRIVLHYGTLILANLGPRGDRRLVAIGPALHKVGHLEKKIGIGKGWATKEFTERLDPKYRNILLKPEYMETEIPVQLPVDKVPLLLSHILRPNCGTSSQNRQFSSPQTEIKLELLGYTVKWDIMKHLIETNKL